MTILHCWLSVTALAGGEGFGGAAWFPYVIPLFFSQWNFLSSFFFPVQVFQCQCSLFQSSFHFNGKCFIWCKENWRLFWLHSLALVRSHTMWLIKLWMSRTFLTVLLLLFLIQRNLKLHRKLQLFLKVSAIFKKYNFLVLSLPGRSQWGGAVVHPGWVSLEGASVFPGGGAQSGDAHQVCPLPRPEWPLEGPVRPCRAQHLPEQVPKDNFFV